jgi:MerR family transcriptional regulator, redox-sensitive transcriptional activator SoxR
VPQLTISEVARQVGLKPSAIRYYERLGILPRADRASGQRRYDRTMLYRLAVIQRARQAGFTLDEIKALFVGFAEGTRADAMWHRLADRKLIELNALAERIAMMQALLERLKANCHCETLDICGKTILENGVSHVLRPPLPVNPTSRHRARTSPLT